MDIMIPYMPVIRRVEVDHKGAFHVAGVKDSKVPRVQLKNKRATDAKSLVKPQEETPSSTNKHNGKLDVWA